MSLLGRDGSSGFFIVGKLEVADPAALANALESLRHSLLADPYFAGVPSFQPAQNKTARFFHAKDDLPEVRYEVFKLLRDIGNGVRFHAIVIDKSALQQQELDKRSHDPGYRYRPDSIYDALVRELFSKLHRLADRYEVCVAKRGKKNRNEAIRAALIAAEREFGRKYGVTRGSIDDWNIVISDPGQSVCLQAADYFLWSLQRFYERREDRYFNMMQRQIVEVHDLNFGRSWGTHFIKKHPLTLEERFGSTGSGKQKS